MRQAYTFYASCLTFCNSAFDVKTIQQGDFDEYCTAYVSVDRRGPRGHLAALDAGVRSGGDLLATSGELLPFEVLLPRGSRKQCVPMLVECA